MALVNRTLMPSLTSKYLHHVSSLLGEQEIATSVVDHVQCYAFEGFIERPFFGETTAFNRFLEKSHQHGTQFLLSSSRWNPKWRIDGNSRVSKSSKGSTLQLTKLNLAQPVIWPLTRPSTICCHPTWETQHRVRMVIITWILQQLDSSSFSYVMHTR